jgi:uncharacterized damage-inducible protein DinB
MNIREVAMAFAAYNRWVNEQIYDAAAALSDADRKREIGGAFGSVHGTLKHLVQADQLWLQRFRGQPLTAHRQSYPDDFDELRALRLETDRDVDQWAASLDPELGERPFHFVSVAYNRDRTLPGWAAVVHLFNHQTHHRGQVMTLLRQLGCAPGLVADLPWMPYFD